MNVNMLRLRWDTFPVLYNKNKFIIKCSCYKNTNRLRKMNKLIAHLSFSFRVFWEMSTQDANCRNF